MSSFCFLEHLASVQSVQDVSTYWGGFCEAFWELVPTAVSSCHFQGIQSTIRVSWTPTEQVGFKVGAASHPPLSRGSQSLRSVGPRGPPGPLGACKKSPGPGVACREVQEQADWQEKTGWERLDRCISGCFYGANGEILRAKIWAPSPIRQAFGLAWHVVNLVSRTPAEKQWKADYFDTFNSWVNCVHTQLISTASYIYNHIHSIHILSYCYIKIIDFLQLQHWRVLQVRKAQLLVDARVEIVWISWSFDTWNAYVLEFFDGVLKLRDILRLSKYHEKMFQYMHVLCIYI